MMRDLIILVFLLLPPIFQMVWKKLPQSFAPKLSSSPPSPLSSMAFVVPLSEFSSISCSSATTNRPRASLSPAAVFTASVGARVCNSAGKVVKDGGARVIKVSYPVRDKDAMLPLRSGHELRDLTSVSEVKKEGKGGGDDDKQRYYVNLGYAIRTLREELPAIFYKEPSFDIYRDDIIFKNPVNTINGIENYKLVFRVVRITGRIFFKTLCADIVSIWQPFENIIMIRWTAHGAPRVPWESHGRFDGISEYKLDKAGKIYEHRVHNFAINSPPKFRLRMVDELVPSLGCPSIPKPTCFEESSFAVSHFSCSKRSHIP